MPRLGWPAAAKPDATTTRWRSLDDRPRPVRAPGGRCNAVSDLDLYFRAANYLAAGQIYLTDNPLLREPLAPGQIKPRLLGHWGTSPGLNLLYAHLSRVHRGR